jgi:hypothetical protein
MQHIKKFEAIARRPFGALKQYIDRSKVKYPEPAPPRPKKGHGVVIDDNEVQNIMNILSDEFSVDKQTPNRYYVRSYEHVYLYKVYNVVNLPLFIEKATDISRRLLRLGLMIRLRPKYSDNLSDTYMIQSTSDLSKLNNLKIKSILIEIHDKD